MSTIKNFDPNAPKRVSTKKVENKEAPKKIKEDIEEFDEVLKEEYKTALIKPDESIFSPKTFKHKLIAGRHNYPELSNFLTDNGEIFIRRFTSIEENLFKSLIENFTMRKFFEILNKTFETCVRSNINIYKLSMLEQINLFVHIYKLTYGNIEADIKCNACEYTQKVEIDLDNDFDIKYMSEEDFLINKIELTSYDDKLFAYIKFPDLEEQLVYLDDTVAWENKIKLLIDKITTVDGVLIEQDKYYDIIVNLTYEDKEKVKEIFDKVSSWSIDLAKVKTKFKCKNKSCDFYNKKESVELPMEAFFTKIFQSFM